MDKFPDILIKVENHVMDSDKIEIVNDCDASDR